jgi:hypothetical protein
VVALAKRELAESARDEIEHNFRAFHPELPASVFLAESVDGLQ